MKTVIYSFLRLFLGLTVFSSIGQNPYILVLGIAQDGGYPQVGCNQNCCEQYRLGNEIRKLVSCIAIVDPVNKKSWMIDATPDFPQQYYNLMKKSGVVLDGIVLTHAHIGHYSGLMYLGREVMGSIKMPVYTMPRMKSFIEKNGPWSQLVKLNNIELVDLEDGQFLTLTDQVSIKPIQVPHRDEFSETVGFVIQSKSKQIVYIPDIDKWNKWNQSIVEHIKSSAMVLIDGTFYRNGEIKGRDMSEIPHPFIEESITLFDTLSSVEKKKIKFIHFNHTNPLLRNTNERKEVIRKGFQIAREGEKIEL
ncbi:MAG: pyrroloquinoline quinone biosynthesis protein PqqB [Saprospiraceae bacterium]|nr:pyrroloquinoline quinone biosynthesis protein PqqB [Saprospiraceae bacterium]